MPLRTGADRCRLVLAGDDRSSPGGRMRDLLYFSPPKLSHFHGGPEAFPGGRSIEVETTAFGVGGRLALGESGSAGAGGSGEPDLETAIAYLERTCTAHTAVPDSCRSVGAYEWMEFSGPFHRGPRVRDWGLHDKGVYTFTSHENPSLCPGFTGGSGCEGIEVLLCGSARHVIGEEDQPRTRMGSGSDWLHDMAAELVAMEQRGEATLPASLVRTPRGAQEYAARVAHDMMVSWRQGPVHVHGHARVLCNFAAVDGQHRLIVATPLYVETAPPPRQGALTSQPARRRWPWTFRSYPPPR
ncbi:SAVMC3_10250 family protein [Streptomyces sp. NPDC058008]|uniref:SAVMC3_10250 family protein n=1 Tax=Streptomyces sp. NPDC058008 TaxID=3346303 RepID=UPI0036E48495